MKGLVSCPDCQGTGKKKATNRSGSSTQCNRRTIMQPLGVKGYWTQLPK